MARSTFTTQRYLLSICLGAIAGASVVSTSRVSAQEAFPLPGATGVDGGAAPVALCLHADPTT